MRTVRVEEINVSSRYTVIGTLAKLKNETKKKKEKPNKLYSRPSSDS